MAAVLLCFIISAERDGADCGAGNVAQVHGMGHSGLLASHSATGADTAAKHASCVTKAGCWDKLLICTLFSSTQTAACQAGWHSS